jgi:hypothetical protein
MARPIVVPVPLYVAEDFLYAVFVLMRFFSRRFSWWQQLGEYGLLLQQILQELPRLVSELRWHGPFTLVEVYDPDEGTEVVLKLV